MNKGNNSKSNISSKKKSKNNLIFEISKMKKPKNRKNSTENENIFLSYNLNDKKNTTLKKIFSYHEISDIENSLNDEDFKHKYKNIFEKNYTIKCIFLDRHVKSYIKSDKSSNLTLDLIEKEEKSKIIDIYLIKSDIITDEYRYNSQNFLLNRKTNSSGFTSNNNYNNSDINLNSNSNLNYGMLNNNIYCKQSNVPNVNLSLTNEINDKNTNNNNLKNQNQVSKINNTIINEQIYLKWKFLIEIENYITNIILINNNNSSDNSKKNLNINRNNNNENSNFSNENIKISSIKSNNFEKNNNQPTQSIEIPKFKNYFLQFVQYFPQDFDSFEHEVIKILSSKMNFQDFSNIFLFLYDDLKKLRDQKTIDLLKNKLKENISEDMSILILELKNFYEYRSNIINEYLCKCQDISEWTEDRILNEIFLTSLIYEKLKNTNELDLTQNYIMGKNIQMVMSALKFNNFIWKIVLNSNKIGEEGMFLLGRVLHYNNKITDLDISLNFLNDKAIGLFVKGIDNTFVNLQRLNLSNNNGLTYESGERIKEILILSPNLKILNISRIHLEKGILRVFEGLCFNKNLEELICIHTHLNDDILIDIANFFAEYNEIINLKRLNLSDNKFTANGPEEFFNALSNNKSLKELIMYNCKIENNVFDSFCKMIKKNTSIEKINLYNNDLNNMDNLKKLLKIKKLNKVFNNNQNQTGINLEFENIKSGKILFQIFSFKIMIN